MGTISVGLREVEDLGLGLGFRFGGSKTNHYTIVGSLILFKEYSLIEGCWSLCGNQNRESGSLLKMLQSFTASAGPPGREPWRGFRGLRGRGWGGAGVGVLGFRGLRV